jgi:hypothetical protein
MMRKSYRQVIAERMRKKANALLKLRKRRQAKPSPLDRSRRAKWSATLQ